MSRFAYNCPSCGAPNEFQSSVSVMGTCSFCRSNVVRTDKDVELIGKRSELLEDMSPFIVGTEGAWNNIRFTLAGRLKVEYTGGFWNEWYARMDNGLEGWLAEAQGMYMMTFPVLFADLKRMSGMHEVGATFVYGDEKYICEDTRMARYVGFEGELPFRFAFGDAFRTSDYRTAGGKFATLSQEKGETEPRVYIGEMLDFGSFHFQNLREIGGWSKEELA